LQALITKIIQTKKIKLIYFPSFLSHIGLTILLTGAVLYGAFKENEQIFLEQNKLFETKSGIQCIISKVDTEIGKKYSYIYPIIDLKYKKNNFILRPKIVFTRVKNNDNKEFFDITMFPSIISIGLTDIYVEPLNINLKENITTISFLFSIKPYINLIWIGFAVLLIGLILSVITHNCIIKVS
jgi:cytochrome c biogenesis factor